MPSPALNIILRGGPPAWLRAFLPTADAAYGQLPGQNWIKGLGVVPDASLFSVTRAAPPNLLLPNAAGVYQSFGANALGRTDLGLTVNRAATNRYVTTTGNLLDPASNPGSNVTITPNAGVAPDGTNTAFRLQGVSTWAYSQIKNLLGADARIDWFVKQYGATNQTFRLFWNNATSSTDLTATDTWQRFGFSFVGSSANHGHGIARDSLNNPADLLVSAPGLFLAIDPAPVVLPAATETTLAASIINVTSAALPVAQALFKNGVKVDYISANAARTVWEAYVDANNFARLYLDTDNRFKLAITIGGVAATTIQTAAITAPGTYALSALVTNALRSLQLDDQTAVTNSDAITLPTWTNFRIGNGQASATPLNGITPYGGWEGV